MTSKFSYNVLIKVVSRICKMIGYNKTNMSALCVLTDVLEEFIYGLGKMARLHGEHCGHLDVNLHDLSNAFNSLGIQGHELLVYLREVNPHSFHIILPKLPVSIKPKQVNNVNFGNNDVYCHKSSEIVNSIKIKIPISKIKKVTQSKHKKRRKKNLI